MLPVTRRAPGTHGSSSSRQPTLWGPKALSFFPLCSQPGIFFSPTDLSSTGHNKEPVSQKHLLSAAAGRPVAEISWRFVRARNCFIALLHLPRRGAGKGCGPAARPAMKKASEGAGHGSMEVHQAGPQAVELQGWENLGRTGKGNGELPRTAYRIAPAGTAALAQKLSGEEGMGSSFPFLVEQKLAFR